MLKKKHEVLAKLFPPGAASVWLASLSPRGLCPGRFVLPTLCFREAASRILGTRTASRARIKIPLRDTRGGRYTYIHRRLCNFAKSRSPSGRGGLSITMIAGRLRARRRYRYNSNDHRRLSRDKRR